MARGGQGRPVARPVIHVIRTEGDDVRACPLTRRDGRPKIVGGGKVIGIDEEDPVARCAREARVPRRARVSRVVRRRADDSLEIAERLPGKAVPRLAEMRRFAPRRNDDARLHALRSRPAKMRRTV